MNPTLADIRAPQGKFQPGDRILVRTGRMDRATARNLIRNVCRFAGCDVRVLLLDVTAVSLGVYNDIAKEREVWTLPGDAAKYTAGRVDVKCSVYRPRPGDTLYYAFLPGTAAGYTAGFPPVLTAWADGACAVREGDIWQL